MTDRKQFEAMLEALINDDQETAKDIFHNIVVSKSREIYEELLSEDFDLEEAQDEDEKDEEEKTRAKKDEDEVDESFEMEASDDEDSEEEPEDEEPSDKDIGGDASDDMIGDVEDDAGSEEGDMSDEEQTDRILDLEDALEELKAEFEQLMAGEGEPEGEMDANMDAGDNMDDMFTKEMGAMPVMEYKHKVTAKMGDDGVNTKSIVAGKNDMGGTTANIAKGGEAKGEGTKGGLLNPSTKEDNAGNVNVPGGNKVKLSPVSGGHGAEKKGKGESADNKKSVVGGK